MRTLVAVVTAATLLSVASCTSLKDAAAPSPTLDLTGTWRGSFPVQGVASEMVWTLSQTGTAVTGPVLVRLPNGIVLLNGLLTGTLTGSTLSYTISVGPQGIPSQPACVGQLGGTMTATGGTTSTLRGSYAVLSTTCTPPFAASADFALTRG